MNILLKKRRFGSMNEHIHTVKKIIELDGEAFVIGVKDPTETINWLDRIGIKTYAEPVYVTTPVLLFTIPICTKKVLTGYKFIKQNECPYHPGEFYQPEMYCDKCYIEEKDKL